MSCGMICLRQLGRRSRGCDSGYKGKARRHQSMLLPEFGGDAHAYSYCGDNGDVARPTNLVRSVFWVRQICREAIFLNCRPFHRVNRQLILRDGRWAVGNEATALATVVGTTVRQDSKTPGGIKDDHVLSGGMVISITHAFVDNLKVLSEWLAIRGADKR